MATSGSTNFSQTRNQVIYTALSLIGCNSVGITPSANDVDICNTMLNMMIKAWQADGLHLWAKEEGIVFLTPYQAQYTLGASNARFALKENTVTTKLAAAAAAAQTSVNVATTSGMGISNNIGFVKNDGTVYWTTIQSITDADTLVIPNPGLPEDMIQNNVVFSYNATAGKPMRILDGRTLVGVASSNGQVTQTEIPLDITPYKDYFDMGVTSASNTVPTQAMYSPNELTGTLYLWPRPSTAANRVQITYERMLEDMDDVNDDFDFPSEWLEPLTFQLAIRLGTIFGAEGKAQSLIPFAESMLYKLLCWDRETIDIDISPDRGY